MGKLLNWPVIRFFVIGYTSNILRKFVDSASKRKTADPLADTATTSPRGRIWSGGKCSTFRNLEPCNVTLYVFIARLWVILYYVYYSHRCIMLVICAAMSSGYSFCDIEKLPCWRRFGNEVSITYTIHVPHNQDFLHWGRILTAQHPPTLDPWWLLYSGRHSGLQDCEREAKSPEDS